MTPSTDRENPGHVSIDTEWRSRLAECGLGGAELVEPSRLDPYRRVYRADGRLWKVVLPDLELTSFLRQHDLQGEYAVLDGLSGVKGIPGVHRLISTDRVIAIEMDELPGTSLRDLDISAVRAAAILGRVSALVVRLARRGVGHNDLVTRNLMIDGYSSVGLVDFDQAIAGRPLDILKEQLVGGPSSSVPVQGSVLMLARAIARRVLPRSLVRRMRTGRIWWRERSMQLPALPVNASKLQRELHDAWRVAVASNASAAGHPMAYYSLDVGDLHLPGERSWEQRWAYLETATTFENKRVLDLGCNLGLLSTWLLRHGGAEAALGIDVERDILDAAEAIATAFGVSPEFRRVDLDDDRPSEEQLRSFQPDVVFALNVLNWVKDQDRLLRFLGRFPELVYEGHDSIGTEVDRLRSIGFTSIRAITISERGRAVLVCAK